MLGFQQQADTASVAGDAANQTEFLQRDDHLMNARRSGLKIALQIRFSRCAAMDFGIGIDKGQVLALALSKYWFGQGVV